MNVQIIEKDDVNIRILSKIEKKDIELIIEKDAKKLSKTVSVDGFRKGKVPVTIVKQRFFKDLAQDAESQAIKEVLNKGSLEAKVKPEDIIGEPTFVKYDKNSNGDIDTEMIISLYPKINLVDYSKFVPSFKKISINKKDVDERLSSLIEAQSPFEKITTRGLENKDLSNIDFVGTLNGEVFEGGEAKNFELRIGSQQFIPTFEEKLIGMKIGETRDIIVKFPEEYQSDLLKGKDVNFKVTLNSIQAKKISTLDDELIERILLEKDATKEKLLKRIEDGLQKEDTLKLYENELKNKILENLIKEHDDFSIPINSLNQAVDNLINAKSNTFSQKEIEEYKKDDKKLEELRDSLKDEASTKVREYFIIQELSKKEKISVSDKEVEAVIYQESIYRGKNPQEEIKYLKENNMFPTISMDLKTNKLFYKLLKI